VAAWRDRYRATEISPGYRGGLHLAFTSFVCLAIMGLGLASLDAVRPLEWLTVPLTFLYANLVEYIGHRGPMHHRTPGLGLVFRRHTLQHHRFFTRHAMSFDSPRDYKAVLFPPVLLVFFVGAFALPAGLAIAWLLSANTAWLFVITAVGYFLNYEWLHFAYHTPPDSLCSRLPGIRRLRQLHQYHHDPSLMQHANFNITYPIADRLFGTYFRPDSGAVIRSELRSD
jgi:sterol desaturase/sphingolipid hydroxylase (fatty acid hydroxylase superfamily)